MSPEHSAKTPADRALGENENAHPRVNGDLINTPEDAMEGAGDFVRFQDNGDPEGFPIGYVETPDGRNFYVGEESPDLVYRQNGSPVSPERSFLGSQPLILDGAQPLRPGAPKALLAQLPRPEKPRIKKVPAPQLGYPQTTPESPLWYAYCLVEKGFLTLPSPAVPFQLAQGQGARVPLLLDAVPEGIFQVALLLPEPGTSTATRPGPMWVQRIVDLRAHRLPYYDLTGPFRAGGDFRRAPTRNETELPTPGVPHNTWERGLETHGGIFNFYVTWTDRYGNETLASQPGNFASTRPELWWIWNQHFEVHRPAAPRSAIGWFLYASVTQNALQASYGENTGSGATGLYKAYHRNTREGLDYPYSLSRSSVSFIGETSEGLWRFPYDLKSATLPTENTTGIPNPQDAPEEPVAIGASYPGPGRKYARIADTIGARETLPSEAASVDLAEGEMMRITPVKRTNALSNGELRESTPDGMPLDFALGNPSGGGSGKMDGPDFLLDSGGSQNGTTKSFVADFVPVDISKPWEAWGRLVVEDPVTGAYAGSVELVLRQKAPDGATADTVLFTATTPGEYEPQRTINASGGSAPSYSASTAEAQLLVRFAGATKNLRVRVSWLFLKDHTHRFRWAGEAPRTAPEGAKTTVGAPPRTPPPPEAFPFQKPDRPEVVGEVVETLTFENGLPGSGWQQSTSGGATIEASAAAALSGSQGLRLKDTNASGSPASSNLSKSFPETPNHAVSALMRPALLPGGKLVVDGLGRPSDGELFLWAEEGSQPEISKLTITDPPTGPGNFKLEPDGSPASVAVVATKEVAQLAVPVGPTASGTITVDPGGEPKSFQVGGEKQVESLTIQKPRYNGYLAITLGGVNYNARVRHSDSARRAADRVRGEAFPGWKADGSGNTVIFEALSAGPRSTPLYAPGTSGTPGAITTIVSGATESAAEFVARVRGSTWSRWTLSGSAAVATFTAVEAGPKPDPSVKVGASGANASISTTTQGAVDTLSDLAARIRAATYPGYTLSGAGAEIIVTASAGGWKRDLRFDAFGTGVKAKTETIQRGKNADLTIHLKDSKGVQQRRRVMENLSTTTIYELDLAVTGAATNRACVSAWGKIGAGVRELLFDFEDVDLTEHPAGYVVVGIESEFTPASAWELHLDDVTVTDGGKTRLDRHNELGEYVHQLHHYGPPTQPVRQDLLIQGRQDAVMPGTNYVYAAKIRYNNIPPESPARPLVVFAHRADGTAEELGTLPNSSGISGSAGWVDYLLPFLAPDDENPSRRCHLLTAHSRDIGEGEIVIQRVALPPGTVVNRSRKYAPSATHRAPLSITTPNQWKNTLWGKKRRLLTCDLDIPVGGSASVVYRAAATPGGLALAPQYAEPLSVPDLPYLRADVVMNCDGKTPVVLKSGSPRAHSVLMLGSDPVMHRVATLLLPDGSEMSGGTAFEEAEEWSFVPEIGMQVLPGGRLRPHELSEAVGQLLESTLWVFTPETRKHIESNWYEPWGLEAFGFFVTVRFAKKFVFERMSAYDHVGEQVYAGYVARLPGGEILKEEVLESPGAP